jgi:hypothetical protein
MTVMNAGKTSGPNETPNGNCTFCGSKVQPPFVYWNLVNEAADGDVETFICGNCCLDLKQGLFQDMIQVAAAVEIRRATGKRLRLVRTTQADLEAAGDDVGTSTIKLAARRVK